MSNGFNDYYKVCWRISKRLTDDVIQVTNGFFVGFYVRDGLSESVFVFSADDSQWFMHEAKLIEPHVMSTSTAHPQKNIEQKKFFEKLTSALVHSAILEE